MLFKKPLPTTSRNLVGNKDRKRLRKQLITLFPRSETAIDEELLHRNEEITVMKVPGSRISIYFNREGHPLFFETDNTGSSLFPTVYALSRVPTILPCFLLHSPVSKFVLNGADLMVPGVIVPDHPEVAFGSEGLRKGLPFAVRVVGNPVPFAVGITVIDLAGFKSGRGRAMDVLHVYGDALWASGSCVSPVLPPPGFTSKCILPVQNSNCLVDDLTLYPGLAAILGGSSSPKAVDVGQIDEIGGGPTDQHHDPLQLTLSKDHTAHREVPSSASLSPPTSSSGGLGQQEEAAPLTIVEDANGVDDGHVETSDSAERISTAQYQWPTAVIDAFLELVLLETVHTKIVDSMCPLHISAVYSTMGQVAPLVAFHPIFLSWLKAQPVSSLVASTERESASDFLGTALAIEIAQGFRSVPCDVKRSSHRKIAKFFHYYAKQKKVLQLKEMRGGDVMVLGIQRRSPVYSGYTPLSEPDKKEALKILTQRNRVAGDDDDVLGDPQGSADGNKDGTTGSASALAPVGKAASCSSFVPLFEVMEFYLPTQSSAAVFSSSSIQPSIHGKYYSESQCRAVIVEYVKKNGLSTVDPECILLDSTLRTCVLTRKEREQLALSKQTEVRMHYTDVLDKFIAHLHILHAVLRRSSDGSLPSYDDLPSKAREGKMQPVTVRLEKRQGNKAVTAIYGIHEFEVNEKLLAEALQKALAASATVSGGGGTGKMKDKNLVVSVQGSFAAPVAELLVTKFGLPRNYVVRT